MMSLPLYFNDDMHQKKTLKCVAVCVSVLLIGVKS